VPVTELGDLQSINLLPQRLLRVAQEVNNL
jgi:hypothetical protein